MPNVTMKAPAAVIGGTIKTEYGNYGPIPTSGLIAVDQRLSAQLLNAGFQNVGLMPTGGADGDVLTKTSADDYEVAFEEIPA
jgi:hypothetical protein